MGGGRGRGWYKKQIILSKKKRAFFSWEGEVEGEGREKKGRFFFTSFSFEGGGGGFRYKKQIILREKNS